MKKTLVLFACAVLVLGFVAVAAADEDFYGIIESRPEGKVGTWVIGGPLKVGACVEVEIDDGKVEEIETEPARKCRK